MSDPRADLVEPPFTVFNFEVRLDLGGAGGLAGPLCSAAFSECDGLEMTMEPKTLREGGNNREQVHLPGPVSYGQVTLKRGMTATRDLWRWFALVTRDGAGRGARAQGEIVVKSGDGRPQYTVVLKDCLPVKLKAPALNAREGLIAVEELTLVCASLSVE